MYEKHFSFKHKPFELVPNPDFLFQSSTHKKAINYLDYGIKEKIGFILLTGEIGSGKTTVIRNLVKNLNSSIKLSKVNNTKVTSEQLISIINEDFGLEVDGKNKIRLLSDLNAFLIEQYANQIQTILLIDEAQNLSSDLLEEIRLLSNLETDRAKLLQIILVGQPELKKTLMSPELMQLRQRININYHIAPLSIEEAAQYIKHRLTVAGNPDAIDLNENVMNQIYSFSRGIPRLINIYCDFALLAAFVEGISAVDIDIAKEVAKDLKSHDYWNESEENKTDGMNADDQGSELLKVAGDIALRLIKVEETVKKNQLEISGLNEKTDKLQSDISKMSSLAEIQKIRELLENISSIRQTNTVETSENDNADKKIDYGEVDSLNKLLNEINSKLKKVK